MGTAINNLKYISDYWYNSDVETPNIIYAAEIGANERIKRALELGEDVNTQELGTGVTPLHAAIANGHLHSVEFLLDQPQIDLNILDKFGRSPVGLAISLADDAVIEVLFARTLGEIGLDDDPAPG